MTSQVWKHAAVALLVVSGIAGCEREQRPGPMKPPQPAEVVARVGAIDITAEQFRVELVRRGADFLDRFDELSEKETVLEEVIRDVVLAETARQVGIDRDPETAVAVRRTLAEHYWRRDSAEHGGGIDVSDDEVAAYYQQHLAEFSRPERRRGAVIAFSLDGGSSEATRTRARNQAELVRGLAEQQFQGIKTFGPLAEEHSSDAQTRLRGGDMGWFPAGAPPGRWDPQVVAALFGLEKEGDISAVVEGARGVYLVKLVQQEPGAATPLPEVSDKIRAKLSTTKRAAMREQRYAELRSRFDVEIDRNALERVGPGSRAAAAGKLPPAFPVGVPATPAPENAAPREQEG